MPRPVLNKEINPDTLDSYYWYRKELQSFAKELGLSQAGGKFAIHDRIGHYLRTGLVMLPGRSKVESKFDGNNEKLNLDTVITDNCKNVRLFFKQQPGAGFKFSIDFMNFMKDNVGATLADAIQYYLDRER